MATKPWLKTKQTEYDFEREVSVARLSERHGQPQQAKTIYRAIIKKNPKNLISHHRLGVIAARTGDYKQAHFHFKNAMELATPSAQLLNDIGYAFYLQERLEEAEPILREALQVDSGNKQARNNLALVLGEQGRFKASLAEFKKVVSEPEAYANLAYVQSQSGDIETAKANYNSALTLDSTLRPAAEALMQLASKQPKVQAVILASATEEIVKLPATNEPHLLSDKQAPTFRR